MTMDEHLGESTSCAAKPDRARPTEADVMAVLSRVVDPELGVDIVELGMVQKVDVAGGHVEVQIALTIAGCPLRAQIRDDARNRISALPGVDEVQIHFGELSAAQRTQVMQRARLKASLNAPATEIAASTRILAIASGKGGVGKSSITYNLAAALAAEGYTVGVLDADIWGFSVPRMLGVEDRLAAKDGMIEPAERPVGRGLLKVVSMGLVVENEGTAIMWRGLMLAKAVEEFLTKVRWGEMDYLVIDMPPGTGDVQMALGRLLPRAEMLIVTTPALAAQKVAARVADMARRSYLRVLGVIENMTAFECEHGEVYALFGSGGGARLAADVDSELVAQIPLRPSISAGGDAGEPAALGGTDPEFAALAKRIVADLAPPIVMDGCSARLVRAMEAAAGPSVA